MNLRPTFWRAAAAFALVVMVTGCASQTAEQVKGLSATNSPVASELASSTAVSSEPAASDSFVGYGIPCIPVSATAVFGQPAAQQAPDTFPTLHGPFSSVGVRFVVGAGNMTDARLDVVANPSSTQAEPSASASESAELDAGTEPGVAARAVLTGFAQGVFSLSLGSFDASLHLQPPAGTPAVDTATSPLGTTAKAIAVPSPPAAASYTVYLVEHLDMAACNGGSPAVGLGIQPLATLIP